MYKIKGELDFYIYDKDNNLVKHHTQSNYDMMRSRLDPTFNNECQRLTILECRRSYDYSRKMVYGDISDLPVYFNEPIFIPDTISTRVIGNARYALSYDKGATWWTHNGTTFVANTASTAADLRATGMTDTQLAAITKDQHKTKYDDHIVFRATPLETDDILYGYDVLLKYDSSLIDPYYIRWISDIPNISRYRLETSPISTSRNGNVYTISISNLSGVAPIDFDTLLTTRGITTATLFIGTFTYVGITIEIDQILVGSYTISVIDEPDVFATRALNAAYSYWGTTTPTYSDGISGGVRHHGAETRAMLYSYNGGPVENQWMYPFMPDINFRRVAMNRSIGLPGVGADTMYGENVINPIYGLTTSGSVELYSSDPELYSDLGFAPILYRYLFTSSGNSDTANYLLYYTTKVENFLGIDRLYPIRYYNGDAYSGTNYQPAFQLPLKDPNNPVIWNYIMYDKLAAFDKLVPATSCNPFHDMIVEIWPTYIQLRRYGKDVLFKLDANVNETFELATATFEDPTGYDLIVQYKDSNDGLSYLASIPITITRDIAARDFKIAVVGDLTARYFVGNISDPRPDISGGKALHTLLKVQDAKNGPWKTSTLLTNLKTTSENDFLSVVHIDKTGDSSNADYVLDKQWNYRNLKKYGNVSTSVDGFGDQSIEFDGTSLTYLVDNKGVSNLGYKWLEQQPILSTYLEFKPDTLHTATVLQNRGNTVNIAADGKATFLNSRGNSIVTELIGSSWKTWGPSLYWGSMLGGSGFQVDTPFQGINPLTKKLIYLCTSNQLGYLPQRYDQSTNASGLVDLRSTTLPSTMWPQYNSGQWRGLYWDSVDAMIKLVCVYTSNTSLQITSIRIDNWTAPAYTNYLVSGSNFTHARYPSTCLYNNADNDPILLIYNGEGWVQSDGVLSINLRTSILTKIPITGTYIPWVQLNIHYHDRAVYYINTLGHECLFAVLNPALGSVYNYNLTLGTCVSSTIGALGDLTSMTSLWGMTDINVDYTTRKWAIVGIPGTKYALFHPGHYSYNSYPNTGWSSLIDMENMKVVDSKIEHYGNAYIYGPNNGYSSGVPFYFYALLRILPGHSSANDKITTGTIWGRFQGPATYSGGNTSGFTAYSTINFNRIYEEDADQSVISYTTDVNKLGYIEYPEFTIGILNDKITYVGCNKDILEYSRNLTNPTLNSFVLGGTLTYNSGDKNTVTSYTASNIYTGRMKNVVNKTQSIINGAYKFAPYMYTLGNINSFFTKFVNTTTYLICIKSLSTGYATRIYFLDTNNSMSLTEITDLNLASVTPNSITDINNNLAAIVGLHGSSGKIGLIYYNINGDVADTDVSKTYVQYNAVTDSKKIESTAYRKRSVHFMMAKNGHLIYLNKEFEILNHLNKTLGVQPNTGDANITMIQGMDSIRLKDFTLGLAINSTRDFTTTSALGTTLLGIDSKDNMLINQLSYVALPVADITLTTRYYLMSDVFRDTFDITTWLRNENAVTKNSVTFYQKDQPNKKIYFIPTNGNTETTNNVIGHFPVTVENKTFSTAYPYPVDAPTAFVQTANNVGYKSWGSLRWYFIDGTGTSFTNNEVISFALANNHGYAIDNWQIVNNFNLLLKSGTDISTNLGIEKSCSVNANMISFKKDVGELDRVSTLLTEPAQEDTFFILFDK